MAVYHWRCAFFCGFYPELVEGFLLHKQKKVNKKNFINEKCKSGHKQKKVNNEVG
jgi:hypothetical protein